MVKLIIIFAGAQGKAKGSNSDDYVQFAAAGSPDPGSSVLAGADGDQRALSGGIAGQAGAGAGGVAAEAAVAGRDVIWVHAVSVGEVLAATQLIRELKTALPGWVIAVSTTTETGQRLAAERLTESPVFYLPLDFAFAVRRYLRVLQPKMLLLMESELWPRLIDECAKSGVPMVVANARISDRSFPRYVRLRRLWRPFLEKISLFLAQSKETAERLVKIGAPAERVKVTGNLKYDVRAANDSALTEMLRERLPVECASGRVREHAGGRGTDSVEGVACGTGGGIQCSDGAGTAASGPVCDRGGDGCRERFSLDTSE